MGSFQDDRIPSVTHRWFCSTADESSCYSHETLLHDATCEFKRRDAGNCALNSGVGKPEVSKMNDNKDSLNENPFSSQRTVMKSHSVH